MEFEVEAKVEVENYFMFGCNYKSTFYENHKFLKYLNVIK